MRKKLTTQLKTVLTTLYNRVRFFKHIKTPTVLQMEAVECGAASLGIILGYYGSYIPLEELRVACGVSRDGSKASNILRAARQYGLVAQGFRMEPASLTSVHLPAIIHWNFNHFLVIENFRKNHVYLNDPAIGPRVVTAEEFDESFTGVVLTFEKGDNYQPQGKKPSLIKVLASKLKGSEASLAFVILVSLALVIPGLLIPAFSRIFVDYYLTNGRQEYLVPLLIGMGTTGVLRAALTWLQQRYLLRMETKLAILNATQLFWHILRLPIEFFTQRSAGDINARISQNDRVAQLLSGELATNVLNIILIAFYALLMSQYSLVLTALGIGMALLNFVALRMVSRKRIDANQKLVTTNGKWFSSTFSSLQQIETIKSTGAEADAFTRWAGYQATAFNASQELGSSTQFLNIVPPLLSQITMIVILAVGGVLVIQGDMTIGMLVAFQSLMVSFLTPINQMVGLGGQLQEVDGIVNSLNDVLNYAPDAQADLLEETDFSSISKLSGRIVIRNLTFGYSRLSSPLIENFNLELQPGMRVALVGGSGSGKSTIARLVAGLYTPWGGQILLDGLERHHVPRSMLNNSLRGVNQELFLFEGSVRENLTMWDDHVLEENIVQAAKDAQIHAEIMNRVGGYEYVIAENGRNFSGGQRQRLEIARALVTNPSIIILDEATSALDPMTEQLIDDNLRRRGCTCLIIAHRLSTIRDCDEIIVLEHGKVVERGTHNQLWRKGGVYTRLIKAETPQSERLLDSLLESLYT